MARPRRGASIKPKKYTNDDDDEESEWEQSFEEGNRYDEDVDQDDIGVNNEYDDCNRETFKVEAEGATPPAKAASKAKGKPKSKTRSTLIKEPASITTKKPAAPRKKKRKPIDYNSDTEDEQAMLPTCLRKTSMGGYAHTKLSRYRISKANRGNTPWNKGKNRSEADKAKIAQAVRARNSAILQAKLKKFNMTEEEFRKKQKEIKYLRERIRRAKKAAIEKKAKVNADTLKAWEMELILAVAARDEVVNTDTGPIKKEDIMAYQVEEEAKMQAKAELDKLKGQKVEQLLDDRESSSTTKKRGKNLTEDSEMSEEMDNNSRSKTAEVDESTSEAKGTEALDEGSESKAKEASEDIVLPKILPLKYPLVTWNMEWTPHEYDSSEPSCPDGGIGGLVCCQPCAAAYSQYMMATVQDMEVRQMESVSNQIEELLGFIEETRMQLMVTTQAAQLKSPPPPPVDAPVTILKTKPSTFEEPDPGVMSWSVTSTLDMTNWEPSVNRI